MYAARNSFKLRLQQLKSKQLSVQYVQQRECLLSKQKFWVKIEGENLSCVEKHYIHNYNDVPH